MTKKQIEKRYKVKCCREMNPYMGGRYYWSAKDDSGKEVACGSTLDDVENELRVTRTMHTIVPK